MTSKTSHLLTMGDVVDLLRIKRANRRDACTYVRNTLQALQERDGVRYLIRLTPRGRWYTTVDVIGHLLPDSGANVERLRADLDELAVRVARLERESSRK